MLNLTNSPLPGGVGDGTAEAANGGYIVPGGTLAEGLVDCPLSRAIPRSLNVTHCVAVPSSEHVAEIVGRQGCKIKALRAKTNTYIKTPVRGEEPVFVITGRPEDVSSAKREVLAAADHFTQIRAAKTNPARSPSSSPSVSGGSPDSATTNGGPAGTSPDKVAVYVKVPYRVVGLVVGPKGATIKRIQQITNTHIVTPSRDKEPSFEVSGKPEDVERAKKEIESYIAMRTGGCHDSDSDTEVYGSMMSPAIDNTASPLTPPSSSLTRKLSESSASKLMQQFSPRSSASPPAPTNSGPVYGVEILDNGYTTSSQWIEPATRSPLSSAVFGGNVKDAFSRSNSFNSSEGGPFSFGTPPLSAPVSVPNNKMFDFTAFREILKEDPPSPTYSCSSNSSDGLGVTSPKLPIKHGVMTSRICCVCHDKEVVAALVPCGHNLFCASCAHISTVISGACPVCATPVKSMLRLH